MRIDEKEEIEFDFNTVVANWTELLEIGKMHPEISVTLKMQFFIAIKRLLMGRGRGMKKVDWLVLGEH